MSTVIELKDVKFSYGADAPTLTFDCVFERGVITALMGASGSGKSTMLNLIAGFEAPQSGAIFFDESDHSNAPPADRPVSMVFQENNLFAHLTIFKNVGLGISPSLRLSDEDKHRVEAALSDVGLEGYGERLPAQLSGGERQRVALARVLVRQKPILLLDEAFASLGPGLREDMLELVRELSTHHALTTLMVTHAPDDALQIANKMVFLAEGHVALQGNVHALFDSNNRDPLISSYLGGLRSDTK